MKSSYWTLEVRSEALDDLTGMRCEHTGWLAVTPPPPALPPPPPSQLCYALGPETSLRYPLQVTRGLLYIKPPMHLG
jgi:hypothetical protein